MKQVRRFLTYSVVAFVMTAGGTPVHAQVPVHDTVSTARQVAFHLEALARYVDQIALLKQQLESAHAQLQALTGTRNLGDILNNPAIRRSIPADLQDVYSRLGSSVGSLNSSVDRIMGEERFASTSDFSVNQASLQSRIERLGATTRAVALQANEGLQLRMEQLDVLQAEINRTQDPMAIGELQARIQIELGNIQIDQARLQVVQQMNEAEKQLIEAQGDQLFQRMFDPSAIPLRQLR